ncbi:MAG: hypothetical protein OXG15_00285 [Gammaproteobacteria bacterium]|nr:hypothetical protein [Gammaproteobacteria bacterium]
MSVPDPRKDMVVEPEKKSGISKLDIVQCCLSVSVFIGLAIYFTKDGDWFFLQLSGVLVVLYMAYLLLRRD